jgi:hypothetical protein
LRNTCSSLVAKQAAAPPRERREHRHRHVGLEQVRVHDFRPAQVLAQRSRKAGCERHALDGLRARVEEILHERAVALQVHDAHLVPTRRLAAHLREQVHLRPTDVERRDRVQDPHASSP